MYDALDQELVDEDGGRNSSTIVGITCALVLLLASEESPAGRLLLLRDLATKFGSLIDPDPNEVPFRRPLLLLLMVLSNVWTVDVAGTRPLAGALLVKKTAALRPNIVSTACGGVY